MSKSAKLGLIGIIALIVLFVAALNRNNPQKDSSAGTGDVVLDGVFQRRAPTPVLAPVPPVIADEAPSVAPKKAVPAPRTPKRTALNTDAKPTRKKAAPAPRMEDLNAGHYEGNADSQELTKISYRVQKNDTFSAIAKEFLGNSMKWKTIWEANRTIVPNPKALKPGMVLTIPAVASSAPARDVVAHTPVAAQENNRTYTVQHGDTLSSIAARLLGEADRWRVIYKSNKRKIPDPKRLPVGATLVIPGGNTR